jgi:hypothetical protein
MKLITFKEWLKLQETGTSTSSVAVYARPLFGGPFARQYPEIIGGRPVRRKKKKKQLD